MNLPAHVFRSFTNEMKKVTMFLQTSVLQSFTCTCLSACGRLEERTRGAPVWHLMMSKTTHIAGVRGHNCNKHLAWATILGLPIGAQADPPHCSVPCCKMQADPWLAFPEIDTVHAACSPVLGKDPTCRVCPWDSSDFLGLKICTALKYLGWSNLSSEKLSSLGILLQLYARKLMPGFMAVVIEIYVFNIFFRSFTKYSTIFFLHFPSLCIWLHLSPKRRTGLHPGVLNE